MAIKAKFERSPASGLLDWLAVILATGFGCGYSPVAPGTLGTVVAIPIYLLLTFYLQLSLPVYIGITIGIIVLGCVVAQRAGQHFGTVDAGHIVIDEIAGFLVGMSAAPASWLAVMIGFVLFRVFDILKPWPARYFDRRVANGFGVVMDDVAAGFYVFLFIKIINYFRPL
jgi:phosphatidylglycerophosphatase A